MKHSAVRSNESYVTKEQISVFPSPFHPLEKLQETFILNNIATQTNTDSLACYTYRSNCRRNVFLFHLLKKRKKNWRGMEIRRMSIFYQFQIPRMLLVIRK